MVLLGLSAACVDIETKHRDWSQYDGPGAEYFHQEEVPFVEMARDPGEPADRAMAGLNYGLLYGIVQPGLALPFSRIEAEYLVGLSSWQPTPVRPPRCPGGFRKARGCGRWRRCPETS